MVGGQGVRFYQVNGNKLSLAEMRAGGNSWFSAAFSWVFCKTALVKVSGSMDVPAVSEWGAFEVDRDAVGAETDQLLEPEVESLMALGFTDPIYHSLFHAPSATLYQSVTLRHDSGRAIAQVCRRPWLYPRPMKERMGATIISAARNGGFIISGSEELDVTLPAGYLVQCEQGVSNEGLWAMHQQRLASEQVEVISTQQAMRDVLDRFHYEASALYLKRGVFTELDDERQARAARLAFDERPTSIDVARSEGVLWQVYEQQKSKGTMKSTLMLLFISLILFVVLGGAAWPWRFVLLLIPILLFHELGHLLAMWVFRYRNLRMFFIPLLGAAVTGKHYTIAGWKKAIVYLMGPVPGIFVGIVIGIVGMVLDHDLLIELASLMLVLNGFNLLPFPPLDGGWITQVLVTSRNFRIDMIFRGIAAIGIMGLGGILGARLLLFLGILILVGLGAVYRVGMAVETVRKRSDLPPPDEHGEELSHATMLPLIDQLEQQTRRGQSSRTLAQQAIMAYESLYARTPGVWASLGLGTVYLGSFGMVLLFGLIMLVATQVDMGQFFNMAIDQPAYQYSCEESATHKRIDVADGAITLVGTFSSHDEAEKVLSLLANEAPEGSQQLVVGQTVMLVLPKEASDRAREMSDWFIYQGGELIVHRPDALINGRLMLIFNTSEEAEEVVRQLEDYLNGGMQMALIPPWSETETVTEAHRNARLTYRLLSSTYIDYEDEQLIELDEKLADAQRFGEQDQIDALEAQYDKRMEVLKVEQRQALMDEHEGKLDSRVIELYDQMPTVTDHMPVTADLSAEGKVEGVDYEAYREAMNSWLQEMSVLLGRQAEAGKEVKSHAADSVYGGYIERNGPIVSVEWCSFNEPAVGLPAMLRWLLCEHKARIKYQLYEGGYGVFDVY